MNPKRFTPSHHVTTEWLFWSKPARISTGLTDDNRKDFIRLPSIRPIGLPAQFTRWMQKSITSISAFFHGLCGNGASASRAIVP